MPTRGQIMVNPDTGDIYEFLETLRELLKTPSLN